MSSLQKLTQIRQFLKEHKVQGFILPHDDEFLSEFTAPHYERLAWLTGFTGSAGCAVILPHKAALFSDGRYTIQMPQQIATDLWTPLHNRQTPPPYWIKENITTHDKIAYDPRLMSARTLAPFQNILGDALVPLPHNPVDQFWKDRPPLSKEPAFLQKIDYSGESNADKRARIAQTLKSNGADALILSNADSIAWLLNIRGRDIPCTPVCLAFAILNHDSSVDLFTPKGKLTSDLITHFDGAVRPHDINTFENFSRKFADHVVAIDPQRNAVWFEQIFSQHGAHVRHLPDPCLRPKAIKNKTEQKGMRRAHLYDGIALCRFLAWFAQNGAQTTELDAAAKLHHSRAAQPLFVEESFPTISAAANHGAITHYGVTKESNKTLEEGMVYLVDSGGQYHCGTTDCTRTLWTGGKAPDKTLKEAFTCVLKGHLRLAHAQFPPGTDGGLLDALARYDLWQTGRDYDHGTGHGVGCFLSVHEGPISISRRYRGEPLQAGMTLSNEPGYYEKGQWGIRLENVLLVEQAPQTTPRPFLKFTSLTCVPFEKQLLEPSLLSDQERQQLNTYHQHVYDMIAPHLDDPQRAWLKEACAPI